MWLDMSRHTRRACTCAHTHTHGHAHTHTRTHECTHACMHACTHARTHKRWQKRRVGVGHRQCRNAVCPWKQRDIRTSKRKHGSGGRRSKDDDETLQTSLDGPHPVQRAKSKTCATTCATTMCNDDVQRRCATTCIPIHLTTWATTCEAACVTPYTTTCVPKYRGDFHNDRWQR